MVIRLRHEFSDDTLNMLAAVLDGKRSRRLATRLEITSVIGALIGAWLEDMSMDEERLTDEHED